MCGIKDALEHYITIVAICTMNRRNVHIGVYEVCIGRSI